MPFGFRRGGCGRGGRGRGGGRRGWFGPQRPVGPPEVCICPNCGTAVPHQHAVPCFQTKCPGCGSFMTRQFSQEQP